MVYVSLRKTIMCHLIGVLTAEGDKTVKNKLMQSVYEVGILSKCVVDEKNTFILLKIYRVLSQAE